MLVNMGPGFKIPKENVMIYSVECTYIYIYVCTSASCKMANFSSNTCNL